MKKLGFTLAEVLITLVIIGVIAAMTVPTLMNNTNSQEFRSAFKKALSSINQAIEREYAIDGNTLGDESNLVTDVFKQNLQVIDDNYTPPTGSELSGSSCFVTADGMAFCLGSDPQFNASNCDFENQTACGSMWVDVNGSKGPNKKTTNSNHPRDIYKILLYNQRAVAGDGPAQQVMFDKPSSST
jgi:prepilin-type N-terminal cleavage/methylation domain-containing protein